MIGPIEIAILVVILLIIFGGYKRLPALGRSAGEGARVGGQKAKELAGIAREKADGVDTKKIANSAGRGVREAKELKQVITDPIPETKPEAEEQPDAEATAEGEKTS